MNTGIRSPLSKQSTSIYHLLLKKKQLSAQEIAKELGVLPNAIYRTTKLLVDMGLIETVSTYPVKFQATSPNEALENYVSFSQNFFLTNFQKAKKTQTSNNKLSVSFIKTRNELLDTTWDDIKTASKTIDHIVSGLELPAEIMLAYSKALKRGVRIRFLVQNLSELNLEILTNWQKMGLEVRYFPLLEARIIIFDSNVVYLTSYNPENKEEAVGIRFAYQPIAKQMKDLFEKKWEVSKPIIKN